MISYKINSMPQSCIEPYSCVEQESFVELQSFYGELQSCVESQSCLELFSFFFFRSLFSSGFLWPHRLVCPTSTTLSNK